MEYQQWVKMKDVIKKEILHSNSSEDLLLTYMVLETQWSVWTPWKYPTNTGDLNHTTNHMNMPTISI